MDNSKFSNEDLLYIATQSIVLIRNLSCYRRGEFPSNEIMQHNLRVIGDLSDALHNIDGVLGTPQNTVMVRLFIQRIKQFLDTNPGYKNYFQRCSSKLKNYSFFKE